MGLRNSSVINVFVACCPKLPSQVSAAPAPRPAAPPPTAPKPALSFLPPPEMGDRPPPAPWAEELKARTNRQANHGNSAAQPFAKPPAVAPKSGFGGRPATSSVALAQKLNQSTPPSSVAPKPPPLPPARSRHLPQLLRPHPLRQATRCPRHPPITSRVLRSPAP